MPLRIPRKPLHAVVLAALALSFLPARLVQPWSGDLSGILWVPLMPAAHALAVLRDWLRPPTGPGALSEEEARVLQAERDHYRGLWHAERLRADEREAQLRQVARLSQGAAGGGIVLARIALRSPDGAATALVIDAGTAVGIQEGDPVIALGDVLVGRVAAEPGAHRSVVVPLGDPALGRIDAVVGGDAGQTPRRPVRVQLLPRSGGWLAGDIGADAGVEIGDTVRLDDAEWGLAARGMRLGVVEFVGRKDDQPLRGTVLVRPLADRSGLGEVIVRTREAAP